MHDAWGEMRALGSRDPTSHALARVGPPRRLLRFAVMAGVGLVVLAATAGCGTGVKGSGTSASEVRAVEPFVGVVVQGSADVSISIGEPQSLVVETDDNLLDLLETDVSGDTLEVRFRDRASAKIGPSLAIVVPALEGVTVSGSAEIEIDGMMGGELAITIKGSAALGASGTVDRVEVDVSGSGDVRLFELQAEEVEISISGSGEAEVHVRRALSAAITGSGHIVYEGDPGDVETSIKGSGTIEAR